MPTTPIRYASQAGFYSSPGSAGWEGASNANALGGGVATIIGGQLTAGATSRRLRVYNFPDFATDIPDGATINGIEVILSGFTLSGMDAFISTVQLEKAGVAVGSNLAIAPYQYSSAGGTSKTYGGVSVLWGTTWDKADLTNAGFGVVIRVTNPNDESDIGNSISVDAIGVRPTFTEAIVTQIVRRKMRHAHRVGV